MVMRCCGGVQGRVVVVGGTVAGTVVVVSRTAEMVVVVLTTADELHPATSAVPMTSPFHHPSRMSRTIPVGSVSRRS